MENNVEPMVAAHTLVVGHLGDRPVKGVIFTHSHVDHFGGVLGVTSKEAVEAGVFGAPFYITGGDERFWGQDRLADVLERAPDRHVQEIVAQQQQRHQALGHQRKRRLHLAQGEHRPAAHPARLALLGQRAFWPGKASHRTGNWLYARISAIVSERPALTIGVIVRKPAPGASA